jgi:ROK family
MSFPLKLNDSHRRIAMLIRQHQPVTRAQLARLTGLGSGPITQVTRDLLLAGLVREGDRLKGGRGQPALPLMLNPAGTLSFGVGMIPGRLRIVAIGFAGGVIDEELAPAVNNGPESVVATVREGIERICRKARLIDPDRILGVGFAVPGFFFADHAHVRTVEEHSTWRAENLEALFSRELGLPCWVENDATAAAIAEYYRLNASPSALITVLINYGIGAGLVLNGRAYRGRHGNAGEIGAFFPLDMPRPSGTDLLKFMRAWEIAIESLDQVDLTDSKHLAAVDAWAAQSANCASSFIRHGRGSIPSASCFQGPCRSACWPMCCAMPTLTRCSRAIRSAPGPRSPYPASAPMSRPSAQRTSQSMPSRAMSLFN